MGQGGEGEASPQRAVPTEPTPAQDKKTVARRVFALAAVCLRCSPVGDPFGYPPSSRLGIQPPSRKQDPRRIFRQALRQVLDRNRHDHASPNGGKLRGCLDWLAKSANASNAKMGRWYLRQLELAAAPGIEGEPEHRKTTPSAPSDGGGPERGFPERKFCALNP